MTIERTLRLIAGIFVTSSVLLGATVDPRFYWFTAFVGVNLLQSGLTNWCPMVTFLKWAGMKPALTGQPNAGGVSL